MTKKILICEDERNIVRMIEVNLQREGFDTISAFDGNECLQKVQDDRPDLIVLDVMMPGISGFDVLETLKADPTTHEIPIIMVTARSQDKDVMHGWRSGVEFYLTKPFNPIELIAFIKRVFAAQEQAKTEKRYDL